MELLVVVHPIDTVAHPTVLAGWRWAVQVGTDWADLDACLNAGWCPDRSEAAIAGEAAAVVGAKVAALCGVETRGGTVFLDHDPIPAGHDRIDAGPLTGLMED